jgi:ABC-type phosphate transport system substrate-binding protein
VSHLYLNRHSPVFSNTHRVIALFSLAQCALTAEPVVTPGDPLRSSPAGAVAVVTHRDNPLSSVDLEQLRRLYLGQVQTLPNRTKIQLIESPGARTVFYRSVLGMTPDRLRRHWIGLVFQGEGATPPTEIAPAEELLKFVAANRGAIAFVDAALVDQSVKVLTVGGRRPSDSDYPIR